MIKPLALRCLCTFSGLLVCCFEKVAGETQKKSNTIDFSADEDAQVAVTHVSYKHEGVNYRREYFMSYPDNVLVVHLAADKKGALSFKLRPKIAYLDQEDRTGEVVVDDGSIRMKGRMPFFSINYEGQIQVLNEGGTVKAVDSKSGAFFEVKDADAVAIIMAASTNYEPVRD